MSEIENHVKKYGNQKLVNFMLARYATTIQRCVRRWIARQRVKTEYPDGTDESKIPEPDEKEGGGFMVLNPEKIYAGTPYNCNCNASECKGNFCRDRYKYGCGGCGRGTNRLFGHILCPTPKCSHQSKMQNVFKEIENVFRRKECLKQKKDAEEQIKHMEDNPFVASPNYNSWSSSKPPLTGILPFSVTLENRMVNIIPEEFISSSGINFGYAGFDKERTLVGFYKQIKCQNGTDQWLFSEKEKLLKNSDLTEYDIAHIVVLYGQLYCSQSCKKISDLAALKQKLSEKRFMR
jgi:hypothetical protein